MDAVFYRPVTTTTLIERVIKSRAAQKHLVICTTKESFLRQLLHSIQKQQSDQQEQEELPPNSQVPHLLLTRTLSLLRATENVHLAFCNSLPTLHAYLDSLPEKQGSEGRNTAGPERREGPALFLVNPISLHRQSTAYSAQGLSKTFAFAVEAALSSNRRLVVVECNDQEAAEEPRRSRAAPDTSDASDEEHEIAAMDVDADATEDQRQARYGGESTLFDPWVEQIPVLNSTTKTFGLGGERGFLGRTVSVADVIGRWCRFDGL